MYRVEQHSLVEQPTLVTRARLAVPEIPDWIGPAFGRVMAAIEAAGAAPAGAPFARFQPVDDRIDVFDIEAGFPVAAPPAPLVASLTTLIGSDVEPSSLPGGPAAITLHIGPYDAMTPAYDALEKWVADHGGTVDAAPWETYRGEPVGDPSTWQTQVVMPYRIG
jgi:effector-binding domain-containing protein